MVGGRAQGHQAARAQGADQDGLVLPLCGEAKIVGEAGGHLDVDAAAGPFPAQEVGLHLQLAVTEQQHLEPVAHRPAEVLDAAGVGDGPVGIAALLRFAPHLVQRLAGITAVQDLELGGHLGGLGLRRFAGEHAALHQRRQGAGQGLGVEGVAREELRHLSGHVARLGEPGEDLAHLAIDHQPQLVDGVQHQDPLGVERGQVHIGGGADQHVRRLSPAHCGLVNGLTLSLDRGVRRSHR